MEMIKRAVPATEQFASPLDPENFFDVEKDMLEHHDSLMLSETIAMALVSFGVRRKDALNKERANVAKMMPALQYLIDNKILKPATNGKLETAMEELGKHEKLMEPEVASAGDEEPEHQV